jgi:cytochrome b561
MVTLDHYLLGYLTFAFMNLTMLSGAFIYLSKKNKESWIKIHIALGIITYILMVWTIWIVR